MSKTGYIYKVTNGEQDYYGSTIQSLKRRLTTHKTSACEARKLYENGKKVSIELMETINYDKIGELRLKEAEYIENNVCINKKTPKRVKTIETASKKDYDKQFYKDRIKNNEKETERRKLYRQNNKDKINARRRALRLNQKQLI
tara:strand:+ start:371 stop:802 length:432 start_codon:yes stop_codon:yes gene_type:complete